MYDFPARYCTVVFFLSKLSRFSISDLNERDKVTVGHWLVTKNNFDCVTHSLKQIEKDYHMARGCVLSPHGLLKGQKKTFEIGGNSRNNLGKF